MLLAKPAANGAPFCSRAAVGVSVPSTHRRAHDNAFRAAAHRAARAMAVAFKQLYACAAGVGHAGDVLVA